MRKHLFTAWILVILCGVAAFANYSYTPGKPADIQITWPALSSLKPSLKRPEILVFLHPKCSCSHATLADLERMIPEIDSRAQVRVVFNDLGDPSLLEDSHSYMMASEIPGIEIVKDPNGVQSNFFGVKTSGQMFLYDEQGVLVFSGGLTPSRGHEGESQGAIAVLNWLNTRELQWQTSDVFGCSMKETRQ